MARTGHTSGRRGLAPFLMASSALVWISAVIVMGILAYLVSDGVRGTFVIYSLVISVLTTLFYLAAFALAGRPGFVLLFSLIFSYLWLVVVVFTTTNYTYSNSALLHAVQAFSFIAFFFLFFNVLYDWHNGFYRRGDRTTAAV